MSENPMIMTPVDLEAIETQYRHEHDSGINCTDPAYGKFTAAGRRRLAKVAIERGLGTDRPTHALVIPDAEKKNLYLVPVPEGTPNALDVIYNKNKTTVNLLPIFTLLDRVLLKGSKEFYRIEFSPQPVQVGDLPAGPALVMPLKKAEPKRTVRRRRSAVKAEPNAAE